MAYALFRESDGRLIGHFCADSVYPGGSIAYCLDAEYSLRNGKRPEPNQRWAEVTFVLIASDLRGTGLGGLLMQHAKDILLQTKTFVGLVLQCKTSLQRFYESCGFHVIPTPPSQLDQNDPDAEVWLIAF